MKEPLDMIEDDCYYSISQIIAILDEKVILSLTTMKRHAKEGLLRSTKPCGKYMIKGADFKHYFFTIQSPNSPDSPNSPKTHKQTLIG